LLDQLYGAAAAAAAAGRQIVLSSWAWLIQETSLPYSALTCSACLSNSCAVYAAAG
jgi:hypothetical protein